MDELYSTIHFDELFPSVSMDELYSIIYINELFPSVNMDELYSTIHPDELSYQSTWTSSTLPSTLTNSPISQHGKTLLYYSFRRALPSVNMDELYSTIHSDELFPSVSMDELYSTIHIDEVSHLSTWTSSTLLFTLTSSPIS